jgi:RNA polymerase sigma factor (sigma-70 family)
MTTEIPDETATPGAGPSDAELISAAREGDSAAFGQLYSRHVEAARRLARTLVRGSSDVDDLVAETFAKLLSKLREGGGPDAAFRAYLLTSLRNNFYDRTRRDRRVEVTDDLTRHDPGVPFVDTAVEGLERSLAARAFARLPERWQLVLWHTEVEGDSPAEVAPLLGLTPNGVSALAYRARERLRQAYLQEHLTDSAGDDCQWTIERLGAHVRGGLSSREGDRVGAHLRDCDRCRALYVELGEVNAGLRGILAPLVLGGSAAAYLASGGKGFLAGFGLWGATRQALRTRHGQAAAAGGAVTVVAAVVALALVSDSTPAPRPRPPVAQPPASAPAVEPPAAPPATQPPAAPPAVEPPPAASPAPTTPAPTTPPAVPTPPPPKTTPGLEVAPAGALVRGRPGVLVYTVRNTGGGGGGGGAAEALIRPRLAPPALGTGPLAAKLTFPRGVTLRSASAGDGWSCAAAPGGALCRRASLPAGRISRAYVPVDVAADAADGAPTVSISAPNLVTSVAPSSGVISSTGLAATMAGTMPANVTVVGNSLLSCPELAFRCATARAGTRGPTDNGDYDMTEYADPKAPPGAPPLGAVSGASLALPGKVLWAGLYWAGSGRRPATPTAYLRGPGSVAYTRVLASRVDTVTSGRFSQPAYQASADVTSLLRANRGGQWWLAVDRGVFDGGAGSFGGWSLVVLVADGGPPRSVAIFDGFTPMQGTESFSAAVFGTAGSRAQVGFVGWEGDRGITGDRLRLGPTPLGGADAGNIAASRTGGTPVGWNTFGVDARVLNGAMPAVPREHTVTANTNGDAWLLGVIALVTPER